MGIETEANTISFSQFKRSAFVVTLNLVAGGLLESDRLPLLKSGTISLRVYLEEPLKQAWYVYYLGYGVSQMSCAPGSPPKLSDTLAMDKS
jgi:hypothetical protein